MKFFLARDKNSPHRFKLMSGLNDSIRVLSTVVMIMVELINLYPHACFVIKGMEGENEVGISKRFRIYRRIIINYFSTEKFTHMERPDLNLYFLLNKATTPEIGQKIIDMLRDGYDIVLPYGLENEML